MSYYGKRSMKVYDTLHPIWQEILTEAIKSDYFDHSLIVGYRSNEQQLIEFSAGRSKARPGESAHNTVNKQTGKPESMGVDLVPAKSQYSDGQAMLLLAGHIISTAERLGHKITNGSDWDRDGMVIDTNFKDFWHFELTDWREMI